MNFQTQKKILEPILKNSKNNNCADCNATTPSWASLDFGVFLCADCAGAHRALGPTFTRVKSTTLDLWEESWIDNMLLGNEVLNAYWEAISICFERKPKWGSSSHDIRRYVEDKYVRRKFVSNKDELDPLNVYKNNKNGVKTVISKNQTKKQTLEPVKVEKKEKDPVKVEQRIKKQENLLDFEYDASPTNNLVVHTPPPVLVNNSSQNMIDFNECHSQPENNVNHPILPANGLHNRQTTELTEHGTSFTTENSKDNFMSFEEMMSSHKTPNTALHHSSSSQQVHKPILGVPTTLGNVNSHQHQNMVMNQQMGQYNGHYHHHYAQSPQPQTHHLQNQPYVYNSQQGMHPPQNLGPPRWS